MPAFPPTPVFPEAIPEGELSAQLRHSELRSQLWGVRTTLRNLEQAEDVRSAIGKIAANGPNESED
jgi:hypothetical protein